MFRIILISIGLLFNSIVLADINKPIRIVIGFSGGSTDRIARIIASKLPELSDSTVIVEVRPGATGRIADEIVNKGPADGSVLGIGSNSNFIIIPVADAKQENRQPVYPVVANTVAIAHHLIIVHPSFPGKNLKDFVQLAKTKPGAINVGTNGIGGVKHFILEHINTTAGIKLNHIPYKIASGFIFDTVSSNIDGAIVTYEASIDALLKNNKLRAIALLNEKRIIQLPDTPTAREQGMDLVEPVYWAVTVPLGISPSVLSSLRNKLEKIFAAADFQPKLESAGLTSFIQTDPTVLENRLFNDRRRWEKIIANSQIKFE